MMDIQIRVRETLETATTESMQLVPGVEVKRVTVVRRTGDQETREVQESVEHTIETDDENFGQFAVVELELLERLRVKGWFVDDEDLELVSKQPFTRVLDTTKLYALVRLKHYDHSLFGVDGQRLPVAVHFSYIDGRVSDYNFDLEALLQHLQGRADVTLHKDRFSDKLIHRIPGYNAGGTTGYHALAFTWHPDQELFSEYCERARGLDSFSKRDAAHTVMGNDQFRVKRDDAEDS